MTLLLGAVFGVAALLSLWCAAGLLLARQTGRRWRVVNVLPGLLLVVSIVPMWFE